MPGMYVARRHSRKLFFPAGLLALAWLLCLGCALLAARPELRRHGMIQLSFPPIKPVMPDESGNSYGLYQQEWYASPAQLNTMYPWHTVRITNNPWQNDLSARTAVFVTQQLKAEPNHNRGLRIEFTAGSQYHSLITMLDLFRTAGMKKYWLDVRHQPISLNTFTKIQPPPPPISTIDYGCLLCDDVIPYRPPVPPPLPWFAQLKVELSAAFQLATWRPLFTPEWRYSTLLLLLLLVAAAWQLRRLAITNH